MGRPSSKAKIEEEALKLFAMSGIKSTTIRDIANASGVTDAALYKHYRSKEDLVKFLFNSGYKSYGVFLQDKIKECKSSSDKILSVIEGICYLFDHDNDRFRFLLLNQHDQLQHFVVEESSDNPVDFLGILIKEGMDNNEFKKGNVELFSAMILGLVLQSATFSLYGRLEGSLENYCGEIQKQALNILLEEI